MPNRFEQLPSKNNRKNEKSDEGKKMSRRAFFAGIGGAFAGNYAAGKAAETAGSRREQREQGNVVNIDAHEGSYKVVYSDHYISNDPGTTHGMDALMLEQRMIFSEEGGNVYLDFVETSDHPEASQYTYVLNEARNKSIPVFFIDISLFTKSQETKDEKIRRAVAKKIEEVLGVSLVGHQASKLLHNDTMSRRQFLQHGVRAGVATYLLLPRAEELAARAATAGGTREVDEQSMSRNTHRALKRINAVAHPELTMPITLDLRNAVMAQKSETVSRMLAQDLGRKPESAVYVGADHIGIEQELRKTEEARMKTIRNHLDSADMESNRKIIRLDFSSGQEGGETVAIHILEDEAFDT